jgi:hypothetical protein
MEEQYDKDCFSDRRTTLSHPEKPWQDVSPENCFAWVNPGIRLSTVCNSQLTAGYIEKSGYPFTGKEDYFRYSSTRSGS